MSIVAFIDQMQMKIGRDREYEAGAICLEILQNQNTNTHMEIHTHAHVYRLVYVVMHLKFHLNSECQNRREKILVKNMTLIMHTGCCFDSKLKCNKNKISCLPISFSTRLPVRLRMCSLSLTPPSTTFCLSLTLSSACRFIEFSIIFQIWLSVAGFVWLLQEMKLNRCSNFIIIGHWLIDTFCRHCGKEFQYVFLRLQWDLRTEFEINGVYAAYACHVYVIFTLLFKASLVELFRDM